MYTFTKEERLCNKKLLDELFRSGSSFLLYPFRVSYNPAFLPHDIPVQVVISVSKRRFRRAHDRNLIKRRIREAYRLHKAELLYSGLEEKRQIVLALSYIGKEITDFQFVEKKLKLVFERLKAALNEKKEE
jgi:ribonuclease P protein component